LPFFRKLARADDDRPLSYSSWRMRWLWLAPVIFFVWANTHGGFAAGYCIFTAFLVCRGIEALAVRGTAAFGLLRRLTMMIVASGLATMLNPYGYRLHGWLLRSLIEPRPEITEWRPIGVTDVPFLPLVLLAVVTLAALIASRRSRDFTHLVLLAVTFWQAVEHQRHIPFFALLCGFWMPMHVDSLLARWCKRPAGATVNRGMVPWTRRTVAAGLLCIYALLAVRIHDRLHVLRVERSDYPVSALQYMVDHDLRGKLVVTIAWAQYAIAALNSHAPEDEQTRVAFDGRFRTCYPQQLVDMHFDFILGEEDPALRHRSPDSPPADGSRVLRFRDPDLVLIDRHQPHSVKVMVENRDNWVCLYQDARAQLWGRAAKYDDPTSPDYIPTHQRQIGEQRQVGYVNWPALPVPRGPRRQLVEDGPLGEEQQG